MEKKIKDIEILAPAGDLTSIKVAIIAKADAIYCGLTDFNARKRAENLSFEDLQEAIILAHQHNCKIYLTLNTIIFEKEILKIKEILSKLTSLGIDGIIVQDWGIFLLLKEHFPSIPVHASTQTTTHNKSQIEFLANIGVKGINFCRELSIEEIEELCDFSKRFNIKPE
ncbi:MAG: U32 family peptidase, partial [Chitinispirillaceae bacterium]|nr:U32 family peptidase [Chitinispirillaceae bacterium]